ncbi:MAG: thioredoxin [Lachnospiraceae bacterium]|nr:thioredoxin [Lachnospiraceae bacterium]
MAALQITAENFEQEVLNSTKPVLVDFWASWCGPCQMLLPVIEELAGELTDVKVCKINVDEQPQLAVEYNVMNIPSLLVFKEGKVSNRTVGAIPKSQILELIK